MKITVTQEDIDNGVPASWTMCAIAKSLRRTENACVYVDGTLIKFFNSRRICAKPPDVAVAFMRRFDRREPVEPFSFWLDIGDGAEPFVAPEEQAVPASSC